MNAAWDELIDKRDQAKALIGKVDDESSRCVLYRYYILIQTWEQIAVDMNYTIRRIYQLHGQALKNLEEDFTKFHYISL